MAVIVENGSQVAGANSYVSNADYIVFAASVGVTIVDGPTVDAELIKAAQFIDSHEERLVGSKVVRNQALSFPRLDVVVGGWYWLSTEIPRNVILCQMQLALDIRAGGDPYNPAQNKIRTSEKVEGAVEVTYAVGSGSKLSKTSKSDALLNSLLRRSGLQIVMERA